LEWQVWVTCAFNGEKRDISPTQHKTSGEQQVLGRSKCFPTKNMKLARRLPPGRQSFYGGINASNFSGQGTSRLLWYRNLVKILGSRAVAVKPGFYCTKQRTGLRANLHHRWGRCIFYVNFAYILRIFAFTSKMWTERVSSHLAYILRIFCYIKDVNRKS